MRLWRVNDFDEGPHWSTAIVAAEDKAGAIAALVTALEDGNDTVWLPNGPGDWRVTEIDPVAQPVVFLLGSGCRGG